MIKPTRIGTTFHIKPRSIVALDMYDTPRGSRTASQISNQKNLLDNKHKGDLSKKAKRKLSSIVDWLITQARWKSVLHKETGKTFMFKINFITLTIPAQANMPSEKDIKSKLLNPWLVYARKYFGLSNYVWKMEFTKAGVIHFHITSDTFIHHTKLRQSWNRRLQVNNLLNDYFEAYGNYNANSTDVHSVHKCRNVGAYIAKYMSKTSTDRATAAHRIWGCNYELSASLKCKVEVMSDQEGKEFRQLFDNHVRSIALERPADAFGNMRCYGAVYFPNKLQWLKMKGTQILETLTRECERLRQSFIQMPLDYYTL